MGKARGKLIGWLIMCVVVGGCQWTGSFGSRLGSWWRSAEDEEYRLLLKSIDEYARKNGLTRQQAIRQLREEADRYAMQQRQQTGLTSQQGGNASSSGVQREQARSPGSGVNQASWAQPSDQSGQPPSTGSKSLISLFR
ncbi:MAG: hypothetical protein NZ602_10095 [Thermoguttaceae bacterium]|nr:hypothetical protein [Thermoguttaceae bacterium]MDW8039356.1 hypothetical protein [Thermoguttaceae bacterium]